VKLACVLLLAGCSMDSAPPDAGRFSSTNNDLLRRFGPRGDDDGGAAPFRDDTDGGPPLPDAAAPSDAAAHLPDLPRRPPPRDSPIAAENQQPGSTGWRLSAPSSGVAGFCDRQSYFPGDAVQVHAADATATTVTWELWRLGYYGGTGGRRVTAGGPVSLPPAAAATIDSSTGMVRAPWPVSFTIPLDDKLTTGFYVVKLIGPSTQSYVPFVVKEPTPSAPSVWPVPFNTYQAYNAWGGTGLYNNSRSDWTPWHAFAVSFDRPYLQGSGAGQLFFADRAFITFAEGQGYDIDYVADSDVDADADQVMARRLVVLQGHAEYWAASQRANLVAALAGGANLVAFGANDLYWQVRYDDTRRVMTGYKEYAYEDPVADRTLLTTTWRALGQPENGILGVQFGQWLWSAVPFRVSAPSSWIWDGTGVTDGSQFAGLYGFEVDGRVDNGAEPAGLSEVGRGLGENHSAQLGLGQATIYTAPSGATVFASGTVSWSQALAAQGIWDARVQQATHNLFTRLAGAPGPMQTLTLPAGAPAPDFVAGVRVSTVTTNLTAPAAIALFADGSAAVADGDNLVRVTATGSVTPIAGGFAGPRGVAVAPDGTLYVADTNNHQIKKISGGVVSVFAGSIQGYAEGKPGQLDQPMTIAFAPSGALLVADVWNMRVRAVAADGTLSTWAGSGAEAVADGKGSAASFWFPFALTVFPDGSAAVAESGDQLVRRIAPDGTVSTFAGQLGLTGWTDGPVDSAAVSELHGVVARADGALVLLDAASSRIRILESGTVRTLAGGSTSALTDGTGAAAGFNMPRAAAFAPDGSLWICDTGNHAVRRLTF
jgi:NHL repeat